MTSVALWITFAILMIDRMRATLTSVARRKNVIGNVDLRMGVG